MKAACDILSSNLETDHLAAWIVVDVETPVEQPLSYEMYLPTVGKENTRCSDESYPK
jgi:hypothetical protein